MRRFVICAILGLTCSACAGAVIEPGHRGLMFDPKGGGLRHEILVPGYHRLASGARIEDYSVIYETRAVAVRATTADGIAIELGITVIYRPIIAELYELAIESGHRYDDTTIAPAIVAATHGVIARTELAQLRARASLVETEIEQEARKHAHGRHVEIASVVIASVKR
jgi:hypothetical protein